MSEPKPQLTGYNAAYRSKLEHEFFDSDHGSRTKRIPMWMREPISRMLREIENSRAALTKNKIRFHLKGELFNRKQVRELIKKIEKATRR